MARASKHFALFVFCLRWRTACLPVPVLQKARSIVARQRCRSPQRSSQSIFGAHDARSKQSCGPSCRSILKSRVALYDGPLEDLHCNQLLCAQHLSSYAKPPTVSSDWQTRALLAKEKEAWHAERIDVLARTLLAFAFAFRPRPCLALREQPAAPQPWLASLQHSRTGTVGSPSPAGRQAMAGWL